MSVTDKLKALRDQAAATNLKEGIEFLAANAKQPGVVSLPSGLQYLILQEGTGEKPSQQHTVTCHYHGTLLNGEVFDSSVQRGQPARFPVQAVIKGWTEALPLMPAGSHWRLFIPPHLAYGDRQVSAKIGPQATLIFDVQLLSFQ